MNEGVAGRQAGGLVQFRVLRNLVILSYANLGALWEKVALTGSSKRKVAKLRESSAWLRLSGA